MLLVGLTGGIGAGKSSVAALLAERGAVILDADAFSREALAPGTRGDAIARERFPEAVAADGGLVRSALAGIVFSDPARLRELEAIVHPVVRERIEQGAAAHRDTDRVVVIDSPHAAGYYGGVVAAPVFKRIAEAALRHLGIPQTINPPPPVLLARHEPDVLIPTPVRAAMIQRALEPARAGLMPDLRGLSAREAVRTLTSLGLTARLSGNGFVLEQSPAAGTVLKGATLALPPGPVTVDLKVMYRKEHSRVPGAAHPPIRLG